MNLGSRQRQDISRMSGMVVIMAELNVKQDISRMSGMVV